MSDKRRCDPRIALFAVWGDKRRCDPRIVSDCVEGGWGDGLRDGIRDTRRHHVNDCFSMIALVDCENCGNAGSDTASAR